jgi:tRNA (guanine37-N1)-methyltransferase
VKIDVITIFPEYLSPLKLSLLGKAQEKSILSIAVHDLRKFTSDNHKSVDDTPYGGGAGMVMSAQPWGEAIDSLLQSSSNPNKSEKASETDLVILTPAGRKFNQQMAQEFVGAKHIIFACGRYEGIDSRVSSYYQNQPNLKVHEISIGDYVLGGGEVAAMVMIEAITRLIPGVIGNPQSLDEESHSINSSGLLEYPTYTKPSTWRGLEVPEVLLSGNHAQISKWRREQAERRTRQIERE